MEQRAPQLIPGEVQRHILRRALPPFPAFSLFCFPAGFTCPLRDRRWKEVCWGGPRGPSEHRPGACRGYCFKSETYVAMPSLPGRQRKQEERHGRGKNAQMSEPEGFGKMGLELGLGLGLGSGLG